MNDRSETVGGKERQQILLDVAADVSDDDTVMVNTH